MSSGSSIESSYINSVVGEGTFFKGDIKIDGLIRIDGDFKGTIESSGQVLIGKSGRAECNIKAETVIVGGAIKGNIIASKRIGILSTGFILGNLTAPRLDIEENVIFHGKAYITAATKGNQSISSIPQHEANKQIDISSYNPSLRRS